MLNLAIPVPNVPGKQDIEIQMSLGGESCKIRYRVEVLPWTDCDLEPDQRVDCVRDKVEAYRNEWELYDIGIPSDESVPLTFINKEDWLIQHAWLWGSD
jgi:hypothetical protein